MEAPGLMPHYLDIWWFIVSQTLLTSILGLVIFLVLALLYTFLRKKNPDNKMVTIINVIIEGVIKFVEDIWGKDIPNYAKIYVIFLFVYIAWSNVIGVVGDLFALVWPTMHHYFRPVSTDLTFNAILAVAGVWWALVYGFQMQWLHFIEKYIPYKGIGIVKEVTWIWSFILKIFDVLLALFIGLLEFIGEFARIASLSLRLFGNVLAGMVLLWLIISVTMSIIKVPAILPLVIVFVELFVSLLQAFVFALLVLVYFKIAWTSH